MPMRTECKHFESRTYANGDTVRKCALDLAPDAPWRCPDACPRYERRLADVAWTHGSLIRPPTPPEPDSLDDGSAAEILAATRELLEAASDEVRAEWAAEEARANEGRWSRMKRRLRRGD